MTTTITNADEIEYRAHHRIDIRVDEHNVEIGGTEMAVNDYTTRQAIKDAFGDDASASELETWDKIKETVEEGGEIVLRDGSIVEINEGADTTEAKPEITKIEYDFDTEDELRTNRRGEAFDEMQDGDIEFERVDEREDRGHRVRVWFENGASMEHEHVEDDTVEERVYSADDPSSVWSSVEIDLSIPRPDATAHEDFVACVEQALDVYMNDSVEQFETGWWHLYDVLSRG